MKTIYKYPLPSLNCGISLPQGAKVLTVQTQNGEPYIWALVDTEKMPVLRLFRAYCTGDEIEGPGKLAYVGTFQMYEGRLIYHLFERYV